MSDNATSPVAVTDRAARRVAAILAKEAPGSALRVAVNGGGRSGFQYAFDVTQEREAEDLVIEKDGAVVLVDSVSLDFLRGTRIDFVDDLIGQSFASVERRSGLMPSLAQQKAAVTALPPNEMA